MSKEEKKTLFHRQKLLLALLQVFGGRLQNIDFQKYLFLFTQTCQQEKSYEFVPYRFGCFSFQSYADRRRLIDVGAIKPVETWELAGNDENHLYAVTNEERKKLLLFKNKYADISGEELVRKIYKEYPYYAIKSEIAADLMDQEELVQIEAAKPSADGFAFFTIGYEGQSFENYLNRLIQNNVRVLCDVRKNPLSRKYGFSKTTLSETLKKLGIGYVHIPELGIVAEKRQKLETQKDYDRLFDEYEETTLKQNDDALEMLYNTFLEHKRVAITCFEAEHCMCHRSRVAKAIEERPGWEHEIIHI